MKTSHLWIMSLLAALVAGQFMTALGAISAPGVAPALGASLAGGSLAVGLIGVSLACGIAWRGRLDPGFAPSAYRIGVRSLNATVAVAAAGLLAGTTRDAVFEIGLAVTALLAAAFVGSALPPTRDGEVPLGEVASWSWGALVTAGAGLALAVPATGVVPANLVGGVVMVSAVAGANWLISFVARVRPSRPRTAGA